MHSQNPILDEFAKLTQAAMGIAQTAGEEAKAAMRAQADRLAAEFDLIRRDDFEALKAEVAALREEIARRGRGAEGGQENPRQKNRKFRRIANSSLALGVKRVETNAAKQIRVLGHRRFRAGAPLAVAGGDVGFSWTPNRKKTTS